MGQLRWGFSIICHCQSHKAICTALTTSLFLSQFFDVFSFSLSLSLSLLLCLSAVIVVVVVPSLRLPNAQKIVLEFGIINAASNDSFLLTRIGPQRSLSTKLFFNNFWANQYSRNCNTFYDWVERNNNSLTQSATDWTKNKLGKCKITVVRFTVVFRVIFTRSEKASLVPGRL